MFKNWPMLFRLHVRDSAHASGDIGKLARFLSTDQVQLGAVITTGLGLLVVWLWWLQVHSLI